MAAEWGFDHGNYIVAVDCGLRHAKFLKASPRSMFEPISYMIYHQGEFFANAMIST